jgi:membrane-associated phospholipid phosphatase
VQRQLRAVLAVAAMAMAPGLALAAAPPPTEVLQDWYKMVLELTRHTATMSPPVASRAYGYIGATAYEIVASGSDKLQTLAGQLNGLTTLPAREAGQVYDTGIALDAGLSAVVNDLFSHTGPIGHHALESLEAQLVAELSDDVDGATVKRSQDYGRAVAARILDWSRADGGDVVENMGFPMQYTLTKGPQYWIPTNTIVQQQLPLLPEWGNNRPFAMPAGATCPTATPPAYSEDPTSEYYRQAKEVDDAWKTLTPDQRATARFWADDAMLSVTPPGHWVQIGLNIIDSDKLSTEKAVDLLMRLGTGMADAFIGCWNSKYVYNAVRPITFIRRTMDPKFDTVVNTPPFPEFPSGHSTQSAAAATVLTAIFGDNFAFDDNTDEADGLKPRSFPSFWAAANEAGNSRLYGGIHYRAAIELGAAQGKCIAGYTVALKTWRQ